MKWYLLGGFVMIRFFLVVFFFLKFCFSSSVRCELGCVRVRRLHSCFPFVRTCFFFCSCHR